MVYLELFDYVDYTLVSSTNSKTSAARLPGSIPGIPTKFYLISTRSIVRKINNKIKLLLR